MWSGSAGWESDRTETVLTALCATYTGAYFTFYIVFRDAAEIAESDVSGYLEVVLLAVPAVVLFGTLVWYQQMDIERVHNFMVARWAFGMVVLLVLTMYTALFVIEAGFDPGEQWMVLLLSAGLGLSLGSVVGVVQLRSLEHERERNRYIAEKRLKERERKQLEYLNQILRHEVLNSAQKIHGYTTLLQDQVDDDSEAASHLDIIATSNDEISEFVQSIRHIMDLTNHDPDLTPVDVVSVLGEQAMSVQQESTATVEIDGPDSAYVLAGNLVNRVFRNLFENAMEHNDGHVRLTVSIESDEEWVTIRIRDNGSGIPEAERDGLFEPPTSGNHGYGLYLIENLVELYGGTLDLVETGPEGTVFAVRLPAVSAPEAYSPGRTPVSPTRSA